MSDFDIPRIQCGFQDYDRKSKRGLSCFIQIYRDSLVEWRNHTFRYTIKLTLCGVNTDSSPWLLCLTNFGCEIWNTAVESGDHTSNEVCV